MDIFTASNLFFAISGGILPVLLWLWFWNKEDLHPEPRKTLVLTFIAGMFIVLIALPAEHIFYLIEQRMGIDKTFYGVISLLLIWSFIEEILKYIAAKRMALKTDDFDEPVDAMIYMITAALGFAAMENIFFLVKAFNFGSMSAFITSNLRFIGATLLHVASSGIIGASISFSFFKKEHRKRNLFIGVILSTLLHFAFNYLIIKAGPDINTGAKIIKVFAPMWVVIIILFFVFEKVKKLKNNQNHV